MFNQRLVEFATDGISVLLDQRDWHFQVQQCLASDFQSRFQFGQNDHIDAESIESMHLLFTFCSNNDMHLGMQLPHTLDDLDCLGNPRRSDQHLPGVLDSGGGQDHILAGITVNGRKARRLAFLKSSVVDF